MKQNIHSGMNLNEALRAACELGCQVKAVRRTGEIRVRHPMLPRYVRVNIRRKDCPRELTQFLRKCRN